MSKNKLFRKMYHKALIKENGDVYPYSSYKTLKETFVIDDDSQYAMLAYNKSNRSSGLIICPLTKEAFELYKHIRQKSKNKN